MEVTRICSKTVETAVLVRSHQFVFGETTSLTEFYLFFEKNKEIPEDLIFQFLK